VNLNTFSLAFGTAFFVFAPRRHWQERWLLYLAPGLKTFLAMHDCFTRRFRSSQSCFYLICCFEMFIICYAKKYTCLITQTDADSSKRNDNLMMMMLLLMMMMMRR